MQESVSSLVSQGTQRDSRTSLILPTIEDPTAFKTIMVDIPCPSSLQPTKTPKSKEIEGLEVSKD